MSKIRKQYEIEYLKLLQNILDNGEVQFSKTKDYEFKSIFGYSFKFDALQIPVLTTKFIWTKGVFAEFLWMLKGRNDLKYLHKYDIHYWDAWGKADGTVGKIYGSLWRDYCGVDQIAYIIETLLEKPYSRRAVMSAYLPKMNNDLPSCVITYQFKLNNGALDLCVYQRSADVFLGLPFDMIQAWLLLYIIAGVLGLSRGIITYMIGDAHLYKNQYESAKIQLKRPISYVSPICYISESVAVVDLKTLGYKYNPDWQKLIKNLNPEHIKLNNYYYAPALKVDLIVDKK